MSPSPPQLTGRQMLRYGAALLLAVIFFVAGQVINRFVTRPDQSLSPSSSVSAPTHPTGNVTGLPLILPEGFSIGIFASNLDRPRVLTFDPNGQLVVSDPGAGNIVIFEDANSDLASDEQAEVLDDLRDPHGLLFLPDGRLVVAEDNQLTAWFYDPIVRKVRLEKKLADLPAGGAHVTRTVQLGNDGRLYVSVGSTCNACVEGDSRRAAILRLNTDGSGLERWAKGLRNTVFFVPHPETGEFWGNDMGRDLLGDDLPPDELNTISITGVTDADYGWPRCYGDRRPDREQGGDDDFCATTRGTHFDYPAHVAPLGLRFIPKGVGWPTDWEGDLLVAWHGSWNRSEKVGYKVVRLELDEEQRVKATHDFVTGFLQANDQVIGRPVDLLFASDGTLYLSDDNGGRIFWIKPDQR